MHWWNVVLHLLLFYLLLIVNEWNGSKLLNLWLNNHLRSLKSSSWDLRLNLNNRSIKLRCQLLYLQKRKTNLLVVYRSSCKVNLNTSCAASATFLKTWAVSNTWDILYSIYLPQDLLVFGTRAAWLFLLDITITLKIWTFFTFIIVLNKIILNRIFRLESGPFMTFLLF